MATKLNGNGDCQFGNYDQQNGFGAGGGMDANPFDQFNQSSGNGQQDRQRRKIFEPVDDSNGN